MDITRSFTPTLHPLVRATHKRGEVAEVQPWPDGTLRVRLSVPFELPDAGSIMVTDAKGTVGVKHYAPYGSQFRMVGGVQILASGLVERFRTAFHQVMTDWPGNVVSDRFVTFQFETRDGQPWGTDANSLWARPHEIFKARRWPMIDRAMRLQRHDSRRASVPCEYEDLARVLVSFGLKPE